jgi:DNA-binding transcriptional LysR family regulator
LAQRAPPRTVDAQFAAYRCRAQVLEHAQRSAEPSEAVDNLVSNQLSTVARVLRLSAPPSISDTPLAPLLGAFQDELRCQRKGLCRMQSAAGEGRAARMLTAWWELSKHPRSSRRCLPADKSRIASRRKLPRWPRLAHALGSPRAVRCPCEACYAAISAGTDPCPASKPAISSQVRDAASLSASSI